jgi:hypothetical protein
VQIRARACIARAAAARAGGRARRARWSVGAGSARIGALKRDRRLPAGSRRLSSALRGPRPFRRSRQSNLGPFPHPSPRFPPQLPPQPPTPSPPPTSGRPTNRRTPRHAPSIDCIAGPRRCGPSAARAGTGGAAARGAARARRRAAHRRRRRGVRCRAAPARRPRRHAARVARCGWVVAGRRATSSSPTPSPPPAHPTAPAHRPPQKTAPAPARPDGPSIYEVAARAGVPLPASCRGGACSACAAKLLKGGPRSRAHAPSVPLPHTPAPLPPSPLPWPTVDRPP